MRILLAAENEPLADLIKKSLAHFHYDWSIVHNGLDAFQKAITGKHDLLLLEFNLSRMNALEILRRLGGLENFNRPPAIVLTTSEAERETIEAGHFPKTEIVSRPIALRKLVAIIQQILHQVTRVVCLGGGTGLFTLLSGLKTISGIGLTSVVSMSDDGGSTGQLRDMFGILPPGDIRRSLVALSSAPDLLNELMQYRFERGGELKGHNLGNLLLTALCEMRGSMSPAVKAIGEILNIQGQVVPVTETVNTLKAELENGAIIEGEHRIDIFEEHDPNLRIKKLWQEPEVSANPDALQALLDAQVIILGPGDLFTSIISNLIVRGILEAIVSSRAKKIYVCNVMTKPGETTDFKVSDHVREVVKYLKKDVLDFVLCSSTEFSKSALQIYAVKNQVPVKDGSKRELGALTKAKFIWSDVASESELVRHDSIKLARELKKIIQHIRS